MIDDITSVKLSIASEIIAKEFPKIPAIPFINARKMFAPMDIRVVVSHFVALCSMEGITIIIQYYS
jgi:hypothetical protein